MFNDTKRSYLNPIFISVSVVLFLILSIRITRGLDLTDEMFYYGAIEGLLKTGHLFSDDLFIQQTVYILFYPVLYLYHSIFGFEGLVFFCRLLLSILSIGVFFYAYKKLLGFGFSYAVASITALTLTFAIPYHGCFAISYNTISQILWIIFALNFFEWKQRNMLLWGLIPLIAAVAHPTSAVIMSLLLFIRLLVGREYKSVGKLALVLFVGGLFLIAIFLIFGSVQGYLASLAFSKGYGVGSAFFSSLKQAIALLSIITIFLFSSLFYRLFSGLNLLIIASIALGIAIIYISVGNLSVSISMQIVYVMSLLSLVAYIWALSNAPVDDGMLIKRINWLIVMLLFFAITLAITSSNGLSQTTGAFMIVLPLLLGIAVSYMPNKGLFLKTVPVAFLTLLFMSHWSRLPYREDVWWRTNSAIPTIPEFTLIKTSSDRTQLIVRMQQIFEPITHGKRTLFISEYPVLYLATNSLPETCMFYMFALTTEKSENAFRGCLNKKSPEVIIDIWSDKDMALETSRIKVVMKAYYQKLGFKCVDDTFQMDVSNNFYPKLFKFSVCQQKM